MWLTQSYNDKFQQEYKIERKLLEIKGDKHSLELFNSQAFGEIALLEEGLLLQNLLCIQSEFLAHLPACTHKEPKRVLIAGSFNLELAFEFLRHEDLCVDFLQFDLKPLESLISFFPHYKETRDSDRFHLIPQHSAEFLEQNGDNKVSYDVILQCDSTLAHAFSKLLSAEGILITKSPHLLLDLLGVKSLLESLSDFNIKMPFYIPLALQQDCYVFLSHRYHPTADIQLQRADMLEGLQYYTPHLHTSAFVLPKSVKKALQKVARN